MNQIPYFTIVVPCYNVAKSILPTLETIKNQNFKNFEVIFVNDGSKDNTLEILSKFETGNSKLIINQENKGLGNARNVGIKASRGKFIALLDADDTWESNKLSVLYDIISKNNSFDIYCHNENITTNNGKLLKKNIYGPSSTFEDLIYNGNCLSPSAVVINKILFSRIGYFTEDRTLHGVEDYDFWLRASVHNASFFYINEFLGNYIIHDNNMSTTLKFIDTEEKIILYYIVNFRSMLNNTFKLKKRLFLFYLRKIYLYLINKNFSYIPEFFIDILSLIFLDKFLKKKIIGR